MEFLLFNEVLKNLIFFQLPIKKVAFITLILSKFQIINANLWSRYEFMVGWDIFFFFHFSLWLKFLLHTCATYICYARVTQSETIPAWTVKIR